MLGSLSVCAQTLIPATSEDLSEFDRQVSESLAKTHGKNISQEAKKGRDFGQAVTSEAKKLGQGVKAPTTKAEKVKQIAASEVKSAKDKDAKTSSPANNNRGKSSNAPGQNK